MKNDTVNWGIMAAGKIAAVFADGLKYTAHGRPLAIGSRSLDKAQTFAEKHDIPRYYGSYEKLVQDEDIDVIYIASPHHLHKTNMLLALEYGKAVLCEKPFTLDTNEAAQVAEAAQKANIFVMEGMWTRFLPIMKRIKKIIDTNIIGNIHIVEADLGFKANFDPSHRLFDPAMGGGALLDLGIYLVSLTHWLLGKPLQINSIAKFGKTGVDEHTSIMFGYEQDHLANLYTSLRTETPCEAVILGEKGRIRIFGPVYRPSAFTLSIIGEGDEYHRGEMVGNGFNYEAEEVMQCLKEDKTESTNMPLQDTLEIMDIMDSIRQTWHHD
ncbi:MAG: gfo/Idh/MocA family oxidoreductase [Caldithrix sp.]|nr:gfo/Idh/MocA family oxidoreductase [Caldithrix sp.]